MGGKMHGTILPDVEESKALERMICDQTVRRNKDVEWLREIHVTLPILEVQEAMVITKEIAKIQFKEIPEMDETRTG